MKTFLPLLVCAVAIAAPAHAQWFGKDKAPAAAKPLDADATPLEKSARIGWLDKQTNRHQSVVLQAGVPQILGNLKVVLNRCMPDYRGGLGQDVAWLDVTETDGGSGRSAPWFSGWMFNTYPEVSTLDHPRYDMQLMGCGAEPRRTVKPGKTAPTVTLDVVPAEDTEAPDDVPTAVEDQGGGSTDSDPYYVPGVEKPASEPASVAEPVAPVSEAPAAPAEAPAQAPIAGPVAPVEGEQQDLHRLMDSGQY